MVELTEMEWRILTALQQHGPGWNGAGENALSVLGMAYTLQDLYLKDAIDDQGRPVPGKQVMWRP